MRKTIDKLHADPSKAEEIQFLNEIAESIPDDAYLKGLFTERFVNFIAQKIKDDWYCDFMDMYQAEIDNASKAEATAHDMQKNYELTVTKLNREIEELNKKIENLSLLADSKSQVINQLDDKYWELRRELDKVNGKAMRDVALLEKENTELKQQEIELKAKMFDMQEKISWLEQHVDYDSIQED
jgi:predicted  nucleic acid-binding Zn-ribbon protein